MVDECKSIYHAYLQLASKFYFRFFFGTYKGAYMWLMYVYDSMFNAIGVGAVHLFLLLPRFVHRCSQAGLLLCPLMENRQCQQTDEQYAVVRFVVHPRCIFSVLQAMQSDYLVYF